MEVIALVNQKGGVLKTTTTANLGIGLAGLGKRVLLIDADPQGSLTTALGYRQPDELPTSLATIMEKYIYGQPVEPSDGILHHEEGVDLMPANDQLDDMDITLVAVTRREYILKKYVDSQRPNYDYILIDCRPSLSMMTINAMAAADSLIIPVQTQYSPMKGLERLVKSYGKIVDEGINPDLKIRGIVMTLHDNTSLAEQSVNNVRRFYGQVINVYDTIIPKSTRSAESALHGVSVYKHDPRGKAAQAYEKLREMGVPGNEIAFIHDAKSEVQKAELFARVRSGQVRVLIGSTFKMGAGTNVQRLLKALHHLDVPWRPSDIEQREGRMVRQGNLNDEVEIYRYVTKGTFDAYSWGLIENKQKFIAQIMTSKSPVRSCEDVDESVLSYAEIKALATGNPHIKEKFDVEMEVAKLKLLKGNHQNNRFRLEDALTQKYPLQLQAAKEHVAGLAADLELLAANTSRDAEGKLDFAMAVNDVRYTDKEKAGKAILLYCAKAVEGPVDIGSYRGFRMQMEYEQLGKTFKLHLIGSLRHTVSLGADEMGNITRINNGLDGMGERLEKAKGTLADIEAQMANARAEIEKPFPQEEELTQKQARLIELVALLKIDEKQLDIVDDGEIDGDEVETRQHARVSAGVERPAIKSQ